MLPFCEDRKLERLHSDPPTDLVAVLKHLVQRSWRCGGASIVTFVSFVPLLDRKAAEARPSPRRGGAAIVVRRSSRSGALASKFGCWQRASAAASLESPASSSGTRWTHESSGRQPPQVCARRFPCLFLCARKAAGARVVTDKCGKGGRLQTHCGQWKLYAAASCWSHGRRDVAVAPLLGKTVDRFEKTFRSNLATTRLLFWIMGAAALRVLSSRPRGARSVLTVRPKKETFLRNLAQISQGFWRSPRGGRVQTQRAACRVVLPAFVTPKQSWKPRMCAQACRFMEARALVANARLPKLLSLTQGQPRACTRHTEAARVTRGDARASAARLARRTAAAVFGAPSAARFFSCGQVRHFVSCGRGRPFVSCGRVARLSFDTRATTSTTRPPRTAEKQHSPRVNDRPVRALASRRAVLKPLGARFQSGVALLPARTRGKKPHAPRVDVRPVRALASRCAVLQPLGARFQSGVALLPVRTRDEKQHAPRIDVRPVRALASRRAVLQPLGARFQSGVALLPVRTRGEKQHAPRVDIRPVRALASRRVVLQPLGARFRSGIALLPLPMRGTASSERLRRSSTCQLHPRASTSTLLRSRWHYNSLQSSVSLPPKPPFATLDRRRRPTRLRSLREEADRMMRTAPRERSSGAPEATRKAKTVSRCLRATTSTSDDRQRTKLTVFCMLALKKAWKKHVAHSRNAAVVARFPTRAGPVRQHARTSGRRSTAPGRCGTPARRATPRGAWRSVVLLHAARLILVRLPRPLKSSGRTDAVPVAPRQPQLPRSEAARTKGHTDARTVAELFALWSMRRQLREAGLTARLRLSDREKLRTTSRTSVPFLSPNRTHAPKRLDSPQTAKRLDAPHALQPWPRDVCRRQPRKNAPSLVSPCLLGVFSWTARIDARKEDGPSGRARAPSGRSRALSDLTFHGLAALACATAAILATRPRLYPQFFVVKQASLTAVEAALWYSRQPASLGIYREFCYTGLAVVVGAILAPQDRALFRIAFAYANGPMALATGYMDIVMDFRSWHRTTSAWLHVGPMLATYCVRWHGELRSDPPVLEFAWAAATSFYVCWWLFYYAFVLFDVGSCTGSRDLVDSWSWASRLPLFRRALEACPEALAKTLYALMHAVLSVAGMAFAALLWRNHWLHLLYIAYICGCRAIPRS